MARTTVRGRSGDIVTTLRVADRTGILAASAPPRAADSEPPSALLAANQGERPAARRVRRNLLLACAAALFLVVGWIGGGVFAQRGGGDSPVMAVGAALDQEQGGTTPDTPVPNHAAPAPVQAPAVIPPAPAVTQQSPARAASSRSSEASESYGASAQKSRRATESVAPKTSVVPDVTERADLPVRPAPAITAEELREMVDWWSWGGPGLKPFAGH